MTDFSACAGLKTFFLRATPGQKFELLKLAQISFWEPFLQILVENSKKKMIENAGRRIRLSWVLGAPEGSIWTPWQVGGV